MSLVFNKITSLLCRGGSYDRICYVVSCYVVFASRSAFFFFFKAYWETGLLWLRQMKYIIIIVLHVYLNVKCDGKQNNHFVLCDFFFFFF